MKFSDLKAKSTFQGEGRPKSRRKTLAQISILDNFKNGQIKKPLLDDKKSHESTSEKGTQKGHKKEVRVPLGKTEGKTKHISRTNLGQSEDKSRVKPETNSGQSEDKLRTNLGQKKATQEQTWDKLRTELRTQPRTNLGQSEDKSEKKHSYSRLVGLQKKALLVLFDSCQTNGSRETLKIPIESLARQCQTTNYSMRKTLQRLEKKGVITRKEYKNGRGGWTIYEIKELSYQQIVQSELQMKLRTNLGQSEDKPGTELRTQPRTNPPSSSSYINIATTTSDDKKSQGLAVTIPDVLRSAGINENHINQVEQKFPQAVTGLQRSLEALAFDIETAGGSEAFKKANRVQSLIGWFFGSLKQGGYESRNDGFLTDEERGEREALERIRKRKAERERLRQETEDLLFSEWLETQSDAELVRAVPPVAGTTPRGNMHLPMLREHFLQKEMASFKEKFLYNR